VQWRITGATVSEGGSMQVVCTQPRRAAAAMTAQRVAEEMNTEIGAKVGFRARFQDMLTPVR